MTGRCCSRPTTRTASSPNRGVDASAPASSFLADLVSQNRQSVSRVLSPVVGARLQSALKVEPIRRPRPCARRRRSRRRSTRPTSRSRSAVRHHVLLRDRRGRGRASSPPRRPAANDNDTDRRDLGRAGGAAARARHALRAEVLRADRRVSPATSPSSSSLQGTGKLRDGRVLNIWGHCTCDHKPCFKVTENQWGTAGTGKPLQPFRTVAVDPKVVKLGSLLYVPLLEGRTMPGRAPWGGFVHDGCVVADDTGGGIDGNQLDLFVGRKALLPRASRAAAAATPGRATSRCSTAARSASARAARSAASPARSSPVST